MSVYRDAVAVMYAPFGDYIRKVIPLMLSHIWALTKGLQSTADEQMDNVAWLARLVTLDERARSDPAALPEWMAIKARIVGLIDTHDDADTSAALEETCMEILLPLVTPHFREHPTFPTKPFHCFWYDMHQGDTLVAVHFINADVPESPFADISALASDLRRCIADAVEKYPNTHAVECGTWMNDSPQFLQLWPDLYHTNRENVQGTGGFGPGVWGQYMAADGGFSEREALLRTTGKHPHPLSINQCGVDQALSHLEKFLLSQER